MKKSIYSFILVVFIVIMILLGINLSKILRYYGLEFILETVNRSLILCILISITKMLSILMIYSALFFSIGKILIKKAYNKYGR